MSPKLSGMPSGTPDGTKTELIVEQLDKIQNQLTSELKELYVLERKILSSIRDLSDVRERRVLSLVYIGKVENGRQRQLSLWQVANEMDYSYDRVRHIHGEALMHLRI